MHVPCMLVHCLKEPEVGLPRLKLRGLFVEALLNIKGHKLSQPQQISFFFPVELQSKKVRCKICCLVHRTYTNDQAATKNDKHAPFFPSDYLS